MLIAEHLATEFGSSVAKNNGISDGYCDILFFGGEKLAGRGATEIETEIETDIVHSVATSSPKKVNVVVPSPVRR